MADSKQVIAALELCRSILVDHGRRAGDDDPAAVVPVVFDGFEAVGGIVDAAARAHSGEVLLTSTHQDGCDSGIDVDAELPDLVAAVKALEPGMPGGLQLEIDHTFVRLASKTGSGYSDAQEVLRGLVASLFHPDVRQSEIVFVVFDAGPLDELIAQETWKLLLAIPRLLKLQNGRTVVIAIGDGRLDVELHCSGPASLRFHLRERDLLVRRSWESCKQEVSRVGRMSQADAPLLVIVTGAGVSRHLGLPLGNELRDQALNHYLDAAWAGQPADAQARQFFEELKNFDDRLLTGEREAGVEAFIESLTLERVLREEQHQEKQRNSHTLREFARLHEERMKEFQAQLAAGRPQTPLASVLRTGRKIAVVTVNFDHGLETELGGQVLPFVTETELEQFPRYVVRYLDGSVDQVPYLKLHGDIGTPDTIVANVDDTAVGLSTARITGIRTLRDIDAAIRPWVYVGYSMRDPDINVMLAPPEFVDRTVEWWVNPFVDPSIARFHGAHRLARWRSQSPGYSTSERVITLTANDYFAVLAQDLLTNMA